MLRVLAQGTPTRSSPILQSILIHNYISTAMQSLPNSARYTELPPITSSRRTERAVHHTSELSHLPTALKSAALQDHFARSLKLTDVSHKPVSRVSHNASGGVIVNGSNSIPSPSSRLGKSDQRQRAKWARQSQSLACAAERASYKQHNCQQGCHTASNPKCTSTPVKEVERVLDPPQEPLTLGKKH